MFSDKTCESRLLVLLAGSVLVLGSTVMLAVASDKDAEEWTMQRDEMIEAIEYDMRRASHYFDRSELSPAVQTAMRTVERHLFVPESQKYQAYANRPLPIGSGQTISQPFIVALMTELLDLDSSSRVLEVGTGSGYQAAVLAEIAGQVYTIEIVELLAETARKRLQDLGYDNVKVKQGDGTKGWLEYAPFDRIIVTAAGVEIPVSLREQLKPGGRMVMPVGPQSSHQDLMVIVRDMDGNFTEKKTIPVRFVPITH